MLTPYADESASLEINGLTVENRLDRVSLFGSIDITRDQVGLAAARELHVLTSRIVADLEKLLAAGELPAKVEVEQAETVDNPFK